MESKGFYNRILDCAHTRWTNLGYVFWAGEKPKVGDECFCRICCEDRKVVAVLEGDEEDYEHIKLWAKEFHKLKQNKETNKGE